MKLVYQSNIVQELVVHPVLNRKNLKRLQNATANRVAVSQRKLTRKFGIGKTTLHDNLKKLGLKYYKRQKAPRYTEQQRRQIPRKCKKNQTSIYHSTKIHYC